MKIIGLPVALVQIGVAIMILAGQGLLFLYTRDFVRSTFRLFKLFSDRIDILERLAGIRDRNAPPSMTLPECYREREKGPHD